MISKEEYEAFREGLTALLDGATEIEDKELSEMLVEYLDSQLAQFGCCGINRDYASEAFLKQLQREGRGDIVEEVMDWAEECANNIRWPVAFVYISTGKLPGGYRENTTIAVVVQGRNGNIIGHRVLYRQDYAHIEDDTKCYTVLDRAIDDCAIELGARSIFDFDCDARLTKSVSVAYPPDQGSTIFNERGYD